MSARRRSPLVYHHTSTRHLPFIVEDGELRPSGCGYDQWFGKTFIWGSTVPNGDPSAAIHRPERGPHRALDYVLMVRFVFPASCFTPWEEIKRRYAKTKKQKAALEVWRIADEEIGVDTTTWWLRLEPLPIAEALRVEVKRYGRRERWRAIDLSPANYYEDFQSCEGNDWDHPGCDGDEGPTTKGIIIGDKVYGATLMRTASSALYARGPWGFFCTEPTPDRQLWEPISFQVPIKSRKPENDNDW